MKTLYKELPKLYLIDATAFCYRAFYALRGLSTSWGQPTNAIYGFVNMLTKIIKENKPQYIAICFDVSRKTFRQEKFSAYKITRPSMPDDLSSQIPWIKKILDAYGICYLEKEGFEADDIIATLVERFKDNFSSITIISSDKDILQLVNEKVVVISPYKDKETVYTEKEVIQRYGVKPNQIPDILALMGDSSDNIPGVLGIGEKTAVELIKRFHSLENLKKHLEDIESLNIKNTLKDNLSFLELSRQLIELNKKVPLDLEWQDLKVREPDWLKLYNIFRKLEFKRLLKDIPLPKQSDLKGLSCKKINLEDFKKYITDEVIISYDYHKAIIYLFTFKNLLCECRIEEASSILEDPKVKKIGYDLKNLSIFLKSKGIELSLPYFDIMVASYLVDPSRTDYSLEALVWDYLSLAVKEIQPLITLELYLKLKNILEKKLKEAFLEELFYSVEMPLIKVLAEMEETGVKVDKAFLKEILKDVSLKLSSLKEKIFLEVGREFNINSCQQLREILFKDLGLEVIKKTKTGPSTDEEVLVQLATKHSVPKLLLEYRQLTKLKSTYLDGLLELINPKTGRIHASFSQISTETGRISSSHPNLQNLPIRTELGKLIRKAVVATRPEDWLVSADYSQIELRILAHLSQDEALIKAFKEDKDIHRSTASLLYGIDEENITEQMRDFAKRINFGIIYGLSPYGLAQELNISMEEANAFIESYFLRYPKVKEFIHEQIEKAQSQGFVTTLLGRRRYLEHIRSNNPSIQNLAKRQAINTPIQGTAADLIKKAMIQIYEEFKKRNLKAKIILQIHDELLFEIDSSSLEESLFLIKEKMENVLKFDVPIKVSIKKGKNWLEMEEVF